MKAELITSIVLDEDNKERTTYGVKLCGKCYYDLSLDRDLVLRFIEFLNSTPEPSACIDVVIEDFLS